MSDVCKSFIIGFISLGEALYLMCPITSVIADYCIHSNCCFFCRSPKMQMIQFQTYHNPYCGCWQRTRVRLETVNHTLSRERMKVP